MKDYSVFYLPFYYSKQTRFRTLPRFFSWIIIYLVPVSLSFLLVHPEFDFKFLLKSLLGIFLVYNLYEIGYIYNDAETIKNETSPTLRLNSRQLKFYESNKKKIYISRFLIALIASYMLTLYSHVLTFLLASWAIIPTYALYNSVRSRLNIPLHFILVTLRYCSPVLLFVELDNAFAIISMILLFPLINTLERCGEKRFDIEFFKGFFLTNRKSGRYIYYFILFVVGLCCCYVFGDYIYFSFSCYALYYMVFRLLSAQVKINE